MLTNEIGRAVVYLPWRRNGWHVTGTTSFWPIGGRFNDDTRLFALLLPKQVVVAQKSAKKRRKWIYLQEKRKYDVLNKLTARYGRFGQRVANIGALSKKAPVTLALWAEVI